jgi:excisionase family DNA binding protein
VDEKLAYTIPEACAAAGIGKSKMYEEIAAKRLRARKLGHRTLILKADLAAWLEALPEAVITVAKG